MRIDSLIELLEMFPKDTQVLLQTCEGDLLSPISKRNVWLTQAFIDERYKNLEPAKLVFTAFVKGQERYECKNDHRGVLVKYIDKAAEPETK